jgi:hypothetical protein
MPQKERLTGAGPWTFSSPALGAGETWVLNFRDLKYNGQKGWFRKHLPLESCQVTNLSVDYAISATFNKQYDTYVVPNSETSFSEQGITVVEITNQGSGTITADNIKVEPKKEPYNADKQARENASKSNVKKTFENITGINL